MFHRIHTYHRVVGADGTSYLPRAYGELNADGAWNGYLAFFPRSGVVAATDRQITEPTLSQLKDWATALSFEDLHLALARARVLSAGARVDAEVARLRFLENEALLDADALEEHAERDKAAAEESRADAERFRRERVKYEGDAARLDKKTAAPRRSRAQATRARKKRP